VGFDLRRSGLADLKSEDAGSSGGIGPVPPVRLIVYLGSGSNLSERTGKPEQPFWSPV